MKRTAPRAAAVALLALVGGGLLAVSDAAQVAQAAGLGRASVDRTVRDDRLGEASGLAPDPYTPDVMWMQNDSGNAPDLFGLSKDGKTRSRITVSGDDDVDWEALQSWRAPNGQGLLVVADIGDNREVRTKVRLLAVPVGRGKGHVTASPDAVVTLTYPDGAHDAETLLLDPRDGRCYVVTKGLFAGALYAVPPKVWTARDWRPGAGTARRTGVLVKVAGIPMGLVTDGAVLPDGRLVLRNYGEVGVFAPASALVGQGLADPLVSADLPDQEQGEGITVVRGAGGRAELLLGSEGKDQPLLRVAMPAGLSPPASFVTAAAVSAVEGAKATTKHPTTKKKGTAGKGSSAAGEEERDWNGPLIVGGGMLAGWWYLRRRRKK